MGSSKAEGEPPQSTHARPVAGEAREECAPAADDASAGGSSRPTWAERRGARQYTTGEEIANAISHGVGAGLSIAGLVLLVVFAATHGGGLKLASAIVFGVSLVLEYVFSTLYHAIQPPRAKRVLRIFDHCAIYLLIAGTYTPFLLGPLLPWGGAVMCAVIWGAAALGILVEAFSRERQPKWVSALIYLVMGWAIVFRMPQLLAALPAGGVWLLFAGGLSYTVGVVFYLLKRVPYMHMVWHLFVLGGSVCHFLSVILFVY